MYLTAREFSKVTGISYHAVLDLLHAGKLPYIKVGTRHKIPEAQAVEVLEEMAAKGEST